MTNLNDNSNVIDESVLTRGVKPRPGVGVESVRRSALYEYTPFNDKREFTHLRYTCVEGRANQFNQNGYKLRYSSADIKILICVSMYAEAGEEMDFTLRQGICRNLANFAESGIGTQAISWENIAVVIVSDGRMKASLSALQYATENGFFDERLMHKCKTDKASMHLFEFTAQLRGEGKTELPLQTIYAVKENNGGKLDSHYWFFEAFAEQLQPEYTFLIDVGTKPEPYSMVRLFASMERNRQVGGCCGEIVVKDPKYLSLVEAAQHFEYKTSNFMGKTFESNFGYISVLPGAFSAYRYEAIRGQPLQKYFYSLSHSLSTFKANMYLAEDRVLCLELVAKQNCNWVLYYVKDAPAITDVPDTITALIKQRRRWLNGSFFAQLYAVMHFHRVWSESSHSLGRKLLLTLEFFYFSISTLFTWFQVANLYIAFRILVNYMFVEPADFMASGLQFIYIFALVVQVIISLRNKAEDVKVFQTFSMILFGVFGYMMIGMMIYTVLSTKLISNAIKVLSVITFLAPVIASVFHFEALPVLLSMAQYYFVLPTYVNIFSIYSLCNTHDVSWGTKGIETEHEVHKDEIESAELAKMSPEDRSIHLEKIKREKAEYAKKQADARESKFKLFCSKLLLFWLLCNLAWVGLANVVKNQSDIYSVVLFSGAIFQQLIVLFGSILFAFQFVAKKFYYGGGYLWEVIICRRDQHRPTPAVSKNPSMATTKQAIKGTNYMDDTLQPRATVVAV